MRQRSAMLMSDPGVVAPMGPGVFKSRLRVRIDLHASRNIIPTCRCKVRMRVRENRFLVILDEMISARPTRACNARLSPELNLRVSSDCFISALLVTPACNEHARERDKPTMRFRWQREPQISRLKYSQKKRKWNDVRELFAALHET